jgi:hypothetical protein
MGRLLRVVQATVRPEKADVVIGNPGLAYGG